MKGFQLLCLATLGAVLALGGGCTSMVEVTSDDSEDFATYRTWNWLPYARERVVAPYFNRRALDARVARIVERALVEQGFERSSTPDFFVAYHLTVERRQEFVNVPAAPYQLSSHHASPSYVVERSRRAKKTYEAVKLSIGFTRGSAEMPWRAVWVKRVDDGGPLPLDAAVDDLLSRFPGKPAERN